MTNANHHSGRLQLRATRHQASVVNAELIPAQAVIQNIDASQGSHSMLSRVQLREIKVEQAKIEQAGATEVVVHQLELAGELVIANARLLGERERTELRAVASTVGNALTEQTVLRGGEAVISRLESHQQQIALVRQSRCSAADKKQLAELIGEITKRRMDDIARQHNGVRDRNAD